MMFSESIRVWLVFDDDGVEKKVVFTRIISVENSNSAINSLLNDRKWYCSMVATVRKQFLH